MEENIKGQKEKAYYHLICVDDDQEFLRSLQMAISSGQSGDSGFDLEPHFLGHPRECFALIQELVEAREKVALIISDQMMPGMTGIEFMEQANKIVPRAFKILLTGYASIDSAKYAINQRLLDQYISKPIEDYEQFRTIINSGLETFYLKEEKERSDIKLKEQMKALQKANTSLRKANDKIRNMQEAAEKIAYLAQGFKKLDVEEVLDIIITQIPPIFAAQYASLFLFDHKAKILKLARTNFLKVNIEQPFDTRKTTPMILALRENRIIAVHNVNKAPYEFLHREELGNSCIIIPFIVTKQYINPSQETEGVMQDMEEIKGVLNLSHITHIESHDIINYKASLIRDILGINIWNAQLYQQTQKLAITDALTGLYNKHIFMEFLKKECERSQRMDNAFFLAMGDIDDFKAINDTYGHLTGDEVLKELGTLLQDSIRKSDIFARFGGEEFAFILHEKDNGDAFFTLERLRQLIAEKQFTKSIRITMSYGLAGFCSSDSGSPLALVERTDAALYQAKAQGKNKTVLADQEGA